MLQEGEKLLNKRLDLHSVFFSSMVLFVTQDLPSTLAQFKTCLLQTGDPEATPEWMSSSEITSHFHGNPCHTHTVCEQKCSD